MSTTTQLFTVLGISAAVSTAAHAINVQPDPQNPEGYVVAKADIEAMAAAKTADPMYQVWAQALRTRDNAVVEAIVPGSATNPENVQRAQRVFPQ